MTLGLWLRIAGIVFGVEFLIMGVFSRFRQLPVVAGALIDGAVLTVTAGLLVWFLIVRDLYAKLDVEQAAIEEAQGRLGREIAVKESAARVARAIELADSEAEVLGVVPRFAVEAIPGRQVGLLVADSSHAHLRVATRTDGFQPCSVESPSSCPAVRQGQALSFPTCEGLDACPKLVGRGSACSAYCVPITVLGKSVGVLLTIGAATDPLSKDQQEQLATLSAGIGSRLGMLRALEESELQAATDPLTGLMNRRALHKKAANLLASSVPFGLIEADLDHFKKLNDTFGHDVGDRALRLFASVLTATLRPGDFVCRYGGEEFVMITPGTDIGGAAEAAKRIQSALVEAVLPGTVPAFTASFGVSDSQFGSDVEEIVASADRALYAAKRAGRDRIERASARQPETAVETEAAPGPEADESDLDVGEAFHRIVGLPTS